ncbi:MULTISPECIES: hypothetical protein [Paenibacillus]|uniref:hypothetical protein n=1 Tax=Paenibacillus sp. FSL F4-0100 TaxID=2921370 RepID=UPI002117125F|nr:hypothetical protein [Paenibacillus lautus]
MNAKLLHEAQYLLVVHPYAVILPQEQLELPVAVLSFVAFVNCSDESLCLGIPVVLLPLQICVVAASRNTKVLTKFGYSSYFRCLLDELEALFLTSCIQISKHFFSMAFSRFNY